MDHLLIVLDRFLAKYVSRAVFQLKYNSIRGTAEVRVKVGHILTFISSFNFIGLKKTILSTMGTPCSNKRKFSNIGI
jgi:hypothetical protein